jgi:hypothetical protein
VAFNVAVNGCFVIARERCLLPNISLRSQAWCLLRSKRRGREVGIQCPRSAALLLSTLELVSCPIAFARPFGFSGLSVGETQERCYKFKCALAFKPNHVSVIAWLDNPITSTEYVRIALDSYFLLQIIFNVILPSIKLLSPASLSTLSMPTS